MNQIEQHPGAMVLCPGCQGECHVSENDGPADRPFRCRSCRQRKLDEIRVTHPLLFEGQKGESPYEIADGNVSNKPASTRKRVGSD